MTANTEVITTGARSAEETHAGGSGWATAALAFLITVVAAALLALAFAYGLRQAHAGRVMPGVSVAGVSVAGLDRRQAETRLREMLPALRSGSVHLVVEGTRTSLSYAELGRDYDLGAMLDAAYGVGRQGNDAAQALDQLGSLIHGTTVTPRVRYDAAAAESLVAAVGERFERSARDATVALSDDASAFVVEPGVDGRRMDEAAAREGVLQALNSTEPGDVSVRVAVTRAEPALTTAEAEASAARAGALTARPINLTLGDERVTLDQETLRRWVKFEVEDGAVAPVFVQSRIRATLEEDVAPEFERQPQNASFRFSGNEVARVIPAVEGRALDVDASLERVVAALNAPERANRVALVATTTEPELTTAEAQAAGPRMEQLSTWTTHYVPGEKNFFGRNISIPTSVIDGYVLGPGETFSFWDAVGDVSVEAGYGAGGAIINGRTEPTGALAGGICSCSTTLFNAAARAGLEIGDRKNHYYYIDRYPVGLDATVWKSSSGATQDMTFRNDTPYPILIRGINATGQVRFDIYGVDTGREVVFSDPVTSDHENATDSVEYVSDLPSGERRRVEYPVDGFNASVTRTVRDEDGTIIHQDTWFSAYATITGIVEVGR